MCVAEPKLRVVGVCVCVWGGGPPVVVYTCTLGITWLTGPLGVQAPCSRIPAAPCVSSSCAVETGVLGNYCSLLTYLLYKNHITEL